MRRWHYLLGLLALARPALAAPEASSKVAVLPTGLEESAKGEVPGLFDDYLLSAVQNLGYEVIGQDDIAAMVNFEEQKDLLGCDDASCFADIGNALGVDRLMHVKVAKLESDWAVTGKLINIRQARVEARANEIISGSVKDLLNGAAEVVRKLFAGVDNGQSAPVTQEQAPPPPAPAAESAPPAEVVATPPARSHPLVTISAALGTDVVRGEFAFSPWLELAWRPLRRLELSAGLTYPVNVVPMARFYLLTGPLDLGAAVAVPMIFDDGFDVSLAAGATAAYHVGTTGLAIRGHLFFNYDLADEEITLPLILGVAYGF